MPIVQARPQGMQNGDVVTEFRDTTSDIFVPYTYPEQQNTLLIENRGYTDMIVNVGSYSNQIISPGQTLKLEVDFNYFHIRSITTSQEFYVKSMVVGKNGGDVVARNKIAKLETQTEKIVNISIDDFYRALQDITVNAGTYTSIFQNEIFAALKTLNDTYGAKFTCLCYSLGNGFDITTTTTKFKNEFIANKNWLSFGFHGKDDNTFYDVETLANFKLEYDKFLSAVNSFASSEMLSKVTRLASYKGTSSVIAELKNTYGIEAVLAAEDSRLSYDLTGTEVNTLDVEHVFSKNGMTYIKTEIRIENAVDANIPSFMEGLKSQNRIAIFTHEQALTASISKLNAFCDWINKNFYKFSLFNDLALKKNMIFTEYIENIPVSFPAGWGIRAGQTFTVSKIGKVVTITGQLEKTSDIVQGETAVFFKFGSPAAPILFDVCAFDASTIQTGIPAFVQNGAGGSITIGWRGVLPGTGKRFIGISITYISA